jgi:hypothetical protein
MQICPTGQKLGIVIGNTPDSSVEADLNALASLVVEMIEGQRESGNGD